MKYDITRFEELLKTDEKLRNRLKEALCSYDGDQTEEEVFNSVLAPIAAEYDIFATFDEFKTYIDGISNQELNAAEISQITGGKRYKGVGGSLCYAVGVGIGGVAEKNGEVGEVNTCLIVGMGDTAGCMGAGS